MTYADAYNLRTTNLSFNNVADAIDGVISRSGGVTSAGTSTAYTIAPSPVWASYVTGYFIYFTPHTTCGASATANISGLGAKNIKYKNNATYGGEIVQDVEALLYYDGTNLELVSHGGGWATWTPTWPTFNSQTFTSVSISSAIYQRHGSRVDFLVDATGTAGGTPSYGVAMAPPIATSYGQGAFGAFVADGGTSKGGFTLWSGGNIIICKYDLTNITAGTVQVSASGSYRV
jgi:hypothetical protein